MNAVPTDTTRAATLPDTRLDAVLALRYRFDAAGVRIRCDFPFTLDGDRLELPFDVWGEWRRLRLHIVPAGDVPRTALFAVDLRGNPLGDGDGGPVRSVDRLDIDLLPNPAGTAFSLVFAGPGSVATIRVSLLADELDELFTTPDTDLSLPPPRLCVLPLAPSGRATALQPVAA